MRVGGDQPKDWTHGGRHEGRGHSAKYKVSKKSSFKLNKTRFSDKNLSFSLFYAIN